MGKGKGGIPDRWLPYTPMGSVISGTRFVACKVPLKEALLRSLPEKDRFGPKDLYRAFPNIGLLVDLTNTDRYYEKQEFTKQNIQYEKIHCPGHVIPPNSIVKKFFLVVDTFLDKNKDSDSVIVVHCTHGVNRTGYFISRYMIQKMDIPPDEAVDRVQQARGHRIERQNYVRDLTEGCKGGSEADMRFAPNARNTDKFRNYRYGKEPSELTKTYSLKYGTAIPMVSSSRKGRRALEPEGRSSRDHWRVRGDGRAPPVDSCWDLKFNDHAPPPRGYPLNCPPRTQVLDDDPYSHWQPHPNQRGPPPDVSWVKNSTYRKPSQNQSNVCTRQGFQEHVSDHQLHDHTQGGLPHPQPRSQQRLLSDKALNRANGLTGQSNVRKQSSFGHSFPKQPVPFHGLSRSQQSPLPPFKSRPPPSFHNESSSVGEESLTDYFYPDQPVPYCTPSVPQQAGPRSFNSSQSSSWNPLPSFARPAPRFQ